MKIDFTQEELLFLKKLKRMYSLPELSSEWVYEKAELYRDAANDFEVLHGLDEKYNPLSETRLAISISDKLFNVQ